MSAEEQLSPPARRAPSASEDFFCEMFSHLHKDVVKDVVQNFVDNDDAMIIIDALKTLSKVSDPEELRAHACSMAQISAMPELRRENVAGDGKCLFRAIAKCYEAVLGRAISVKLLIELTVDMMSGDDLHMVTQSLRFGLDYDHLDDDAMVANYLRDVKQNKIWGGDIELQTIADLLSVRIQVWTTFDEYSKKLGDKLSSDVSVYQVSKDVHYITYGSMSCFGTGSVGTLHLLYSGTSHYDCLLPVVPR